MVGLLNRKEATMQYKTMVLGLLEQRPGLHEHLRKNRMLLPAVEVYARMLKSSHEAWKESLLQAGPESDESQIASGALELALKELQDGLPSGSPTVEEPLTLDEAMAFIRSHTPPE
jgi:hypothetical protein